MDALTLCFVEFGSAYGVIGTTFSIAGGIVALASACVAVRSKNAVVTARKTQDSFDEVQVISKLLSDVEAVLYVFFKYGPSATSGQFDGADYASDGIQAQRVVEALGQEKGRLGHNKLLQETLSRIPKHIETFSNARGNKNIRPAGNEIREDLGIVAREVKARAAELRTLHLDYASRAKYAGN